MRAPSPLLTAVPADETVADPLLVPVGAALRRARRQHRMSQHFLGVLVGTSQQNVSRWEQGLGAPEPSTRAALEDILGVPAALWSRDRSRQLAAG